MKTPLIHRSVVRQFTLDVIAAQRPHLKDKLTRVSEEFLVHMESNLRQSIINHINAHPSMGHTVR